MAGFKKSERCFKVPRLGQNGDSVEFHERPSRISRKRHRSNHRRTKTNVSRACIYLYIQPAIRYKMIQNALCDTQFPRDAGSRAILEVALIHRCAHTCKSVRKQRAPLYSRGNNVAINCGINATAVIPRCRQYRADINQELLSSISFCR